jgi:hypothetical protein
MTYRFLCKYFPPKLSAWLTAIWFATLLFLIFIFSVFREGDFVYIDF